MKTPEITATHFSASFGACFPNKDQLKEGAERVFWAVSGFFNFPINFFTQGLADFLGLETLRHGTSWSNYVNIRMNGPDPKYGGGSTGATFGNKAAKTGQAEAQDRYIAHSKGKFFAYLDSNAGRKTTYIDKNGVQKTIDFQWHQYIYTQFHVRFATHSYAFGAGAGSAAPADATGKAIVVWRFLMGVLSFFSPTVKLRFRPEEVMQRFENDPLLPGRAVFTRQPVSSDHLGLTGIFKQAADGKVFERMKANPTKTVWGAIRVINPIGLALLAAFGIYYHYHAHALQSKHSISVI